MALHLVEPSGEGSKSGKKPVKTEEDKTGLAVALENFDFSKCLVTAGQPCVHAVQFQEGSTIHSGTLYCNRTGNVIVLTPDLAAGCADPIAPESIQEPPDFLH